MDVYNPIFGITWPGPGVMGISIVLFMIFLGLMVYLLLLYLRMKERDRLHNYQLFLFQVKRKGLSNFQIKILNNMASYMKLSNPTNMASNAVLFESMLSNFAEYLQKSRESSEERRDICHDLLMIYQKLYEQRTYGAPLLSMSEIEDGQILYLATEPDNAYIGKVCGRGKNFIAIHLFTALKNLKDFDSEQKLAIYIIRLNDAEYRINTKSVGVENNNLLVALSDDLVREKEFRHPYINVVIPAIIIQEGWSETGEEIQFDGTIYRLNEFECELRTETEMHFEKDFVLCFEISDYSFRAVSNVISSRKVDHDKVYYVALKFKNMSKPAMAVISTFVMDHL